MKCCIKHRKLHIQQTTIYFSFGFWTDWIISMIRSHNTTKKTTKYQEKQVENIFRNMIRNTKQKLITYYYISLCYLIDKKQHHLNDLIKSSCFSAAIMSNN